MRTARFSSAQRSEMRPQAPWRCLPTLPAWQPIREPPGPALGKLAWCLWEAGSWARWAEQGSREPWLSRL